ncbi:MAG: metallophosphoesterase [Pseudomonadota bacterium]
MLVLVISDLHLGRGKFLKSGQLNILEDFFEDEHFCEFLDYYSTDEYTEQEVQLVLNGDILNLIQIDIDGVFHHLIDEWVTTLALKRILDGHPSFFRALKKFLARPNKKLTYVIGNHDLGMTFQGAQETFNHAVGQKVEFVFEWEKTGVHIEHGHRFEEMNSDDYDKIFREGPAGKKILSLPWGGLFCVLALPRLKKERPYIDRVRPMASYLWWCLFHDFRYFLWMNLVMMKYFIQAWFNPYLRPKTDMRSTLRLLQKFTMYPNFEKKGHSLLKDNLMLKVVVMGHTHLQEWRRFPGERYYFNTGTWNAIPSMDPARYQNVTQLSYVALDLGPKSQILSTASLNLWKGKWRPYEEEVKLGPVS